VFGLLSPKPQECASGPAFQPCQGAFLPMPPENQELDMQVVEPRHRGFTPKMTLDHFFYLAFVVPAHNAPRPI
jgi:hypothetical protein